jgi:hypothetical protein
MERWFQKDEIFLQKFVDSINQDGSDSEIFEACNKIFIEQTSEEANQAEPEVRNERRSKRTIVHDEGDDENLSDNIQPKKSVSFDI